MALNIESKAKENSSQIANTDIVKKLGVGKSLPKRVNSAIAIIIILIGSIMLLWFWNYNSSRLNYKTEKVMRDNLIVTVTTTGTLQPVNQVDVGSEISGTVKTVVVDTNEIVKQGQTLAILNTDQLEAKVNQTHALLQLAQAKVKQAEATVLETGNTLKRSRALEKSGMCSEQDCDAAQAAYDRAAAALLIAKAQVAQAQASLNAEQTLLAKATIHSPINGIVLQRVVEPGQTVAATLQTPVLFVLAEDLSKMELHVGVDEADVSKIKEGQNALFTVDAYPNKNFSATITEVYFASQTVAGVVTYETILRVDNSALLLRPGMTATADITVNKVENALLVPNAALRFTPPDQKKIAAPNQDTSVRQQAPRSSSKQKKDTLKTESHKINLKTNGTQQQVWILRDGKTVAIPISIGASNGIMTEVISGQVEPGMGLLVNIIRTDQ